MAILMRLSPWLIPSMHIRPMVMPIRRWQMRINPTHTPLASFAASLWLTRNRLWPLAMGPIRLSLTVWHFGKLLKGHRQIPVESARAGV